MSASRKRGLSPVIASVLLVSIALVLATIIFFWARTFIGEQIQKQGRTIELFCEQVRFEVEAVYPNLYVENTGSVPLFGVEIKKKRVLGEIVQAEEFSSPSVLPGETADPVPLPNGIEEGDTLIIIPLLLGEAEDYLRFHVCDEAYGVEILVQEA